MLAKEYAQVLFELGSRGGANSTTLVKNLMQILKAKGHEKLLPRISAEYERLQQNSGGKGILVRVADEKARKDGLHKAHALAEQYSLSTSLIRVVDDPNLIQGYAIEGPGFRFDASARASLLNLYRHLKTN